MFLIFSQVPNRKIKKIGVVGAGVMGAQIAVILLNKGFFVYMKDISPEAIKSGLKHVSGSFNVLVENRRLTPDARDSMLKVLYFMLKDSIRLMLLERC